MTIGTILCLLATTHITAEVSLVDSTAFDEVIHDLAFYDGMHGYALAGTRWHYLLRTTDGGMNWVAENIDIGAFDGYKYNEVATIGETGLLLGDQTGSIWYRAHPDSMWYPTWYGDNNEIREIEVIDENGWIAITDSLLLVTRDRGDSYTSYTGGDHSSGRFVAVDVTNASLMHAIIGFSLLRSTDGGETWDVPEIGRGPFVPITDLRFASTKRGWIVGWYPWHLYQTDDSGRSWSTGPFEQIMAIGFSPEGLSAYTTFSYLRASHDGGLTWTDSLALPSIGNESILWARQRLVAAGEDGLFLLLASSDARKSIVARIGATSGIRNEIRQPGRPLDLE